MATTSGNITDYGGGVQANNVSLIDSSGNVLTPAGANSAFVTVEKIRPNDGNAYIPNDAIANSTSAPTVWTWTNALRVAAGGATIVYAGLFTDQVANVATYRLYLYSAAPTPINDNAETTFLYASIASYIGYIDFPALVKDSANSTAAKMELSGALLGIAAGMAAGRDIYGLLKTTLAFTPAALQKFSISLKFAQD